MPINNAEMMRLGLELGVPTKLIFDEDNPDGIVLPAWAITGEAARRMDEQIEEGRPHRVLERFIREGCCATRGHVVEKSTDARDRAIVLRHLDAYGNESEYRVFDRVLCDVWDGRWIEEVIAWLRRVHADEETLAHP